MTPVFKKRVVHVNKTRCIYCFDFSFLVPSCIQELLVIFKGIILIRNVYVAEFYDGRINVGVIFIVI